ncbi:hypothetical protein UPYG_G00199250 [Umbra pygmaea]|uniref:Thyroglobulin type-1 domain-containing protein n=1 Tax=Umbra pygmaea TaxID=75934 RepID=A0ABD0WJG8_UMBPY
MDSFSALSKKINTTWCVNMRLVVAVLLLLSFTTYLGSTTGILIGQTPCQQARANTPSIAGAYRPQCDSQGRYTPQQCWPSSGYTWCVNNKGEELPGTLLQGYNRRKCNVTSLTPCQWADSICPHLLGSYCPTCDIFGQYTPLQIWSAGYSWCVTTSGQKIPGSLRRSRNDLPPLNCTKTELTLCEKASAICPKAAGVSISMDNAQIRNSPVNEDIPLHPVMHIYTLKGCSSNIFRIFSTPV